jgi:WD40 repeat protein
VPEDTTPILEDGPFGPSKSSLDTFERLAKIFAIVAIPVVIPIALAIYTAKVQKGSEDETLNRDYVQLAVSLLKEKKNDLDPGIRDWAVDLLAEHSPTKFKPEVIAALKSGNISLPNSGPWPHLTALSPDRKLVADTTPNIVLISNTSTGRVLMSIPVSLPVTLLAFSMDGTQLLITLADGTDSEWDLKTGRLLRRSKASR